jgi:DNA polymerase-4
VSRRTILHVDLDAFFAAVEQRDRPELRGKPVIVGGGGPDQRGVVSTASYEARIYGVHSAMPLRTAGRLCPQGVFLPVDGRKYQGVSKQVMAILRRYTPLVQPISIDEAFLDVTGSRQLFGDGRAIARSIKQAVVDEVDLTISVGVAATKLVAKVASDLRKPDGLVVVPPGEEAAFLAPLPISRLWGVGEKTASALREFGVVTIGDLASLPADTLERRFGKHGGSLATRARGMDEDPVATGDPAKSIGHEHTFDVDTSSREVIERTLLGMADGVAWRLRAAGLRAATVTLKLRDSSFRTITRQTTLEVPADLTEPIYDAAIALLRRELRGQRIRLVGVTASNFREREQLALFGEGDPRRRATAEALDTIRRRYGSKAVTRARLVKAALPEPFERDPMTAVEHRGGARRGRGAEGPTEFREQANEPVFDDRLGDTEGAEDLDADA